MGCVLLDLGPVASRLFGVARWVGRGARLGCEAFGWLEWAFERLTFWGEAYLCCCFWIPEAWWKTHRCMAESFSFCW